MSGPGKSAAEIQRDSDVIKLTAAIHGVKMLIGEERFAAAQAGLPGTLRPSAPAGTGTAASADDTLALARAAGVGRFAAEQEGSDAPLADDGSATLALARAAGIGRYGQ